MYYLGTPDQLWVIIKGTASLTRCLSLLFVCTWPEGYQELRNMAEDLYLAKHLAGFDPGIFYFFTTP